MLRVVGNHDGLSGWYSVKRIEVTVTDSTDNIPVRKMTRAESGRLGGLKKGKKGFALNRELAVRAGRLGGKAGKGVPRKWSRRSS